MANGMNYSALFTLTAVDSLAKYTYNSEIVILSEKHLFPSRKRVSITQHCNQPTARIDTMIGSIARGHSGAGAQADHLPIKRKMRETDDDGAGRGKSPSHL